MSDLTVNMQRLRLELQRARNDLDEALDNWQKAVKDLEAAQTERIEAIRKEKHTEQWYADRLQLLRDFMTSKDLLTEFCDITANGQAAHLTPPPSMGVLLNLANHRADEAEKRVKTLASVLLDFAESGCEYGDDCPSNAGTRHGICTPCQSREALKAAKVPLRD